VLRPPTAVSNDGDVADLVPLPPQPADVPWPTYSWPKGTPSADVDVEGLLDDVFGGGAFGTGYASVVVHHGRLIAERYASAIEHWDREAEPVGPDTQLLSWSMAKSFLHAAVGILVGDGKLDPSARAGVPAWAGDERAAIKLDDLLAMRDGLEWNEDYVDAGVSHVIEMLFGDGASDVVGYAESRPRLTAPDTRFNYSSGTSNIVSGIVARQVGRGDDFERFLRGRLLEPIGITHARLGLDPAGVWIGSSYLYAPAREFAKFGLLYLRDGVWDGRRLLPEGWVDHGRRARSVDESDGRLHGAHWWAVGDELGSWWASGYDGQSILICPALDLIVVRLGHSPDEGAADALHEWRARVVAAFAAAA
jgi:CubicO group peptidase (beta-lactamase class C family)